MRSRSIALLPLAAILVFAAAADAEARGGKSFSGLLGGKSSGSKSGTSSGDKTAHNPDRGGQDRSKTASDPRASDPRGDPRLQPSYGARGYRPASVYPRVSYGSQRAAAAGVSATAAVPVFTPTAAAPVVAAPAPVAMAADGDTRVRVENKKYRDPGAVEWCPASAYVFDDIRGCRPKG